jgi:hypothetical protein
MQLTLPASLTTTVQFYTVGSAPGYAIGAATGDERNGSASGNTYTYDAEELTTGDYWCQLLISGVGTGVYFPVRDNVAYPWTPWTVIESTIVAVPPTPSPITGLCNLLFSIVDGSGSPVYKASCYAQLDVNSTYDGGLVASTVYSAQTDADGLATLVCIRNNQFTAGGIYTLRATDRQGLLLWTKRVRMPNTASANAEDLTSV